RSLAVYSSPTWKPVTRNGGFWDEPIGLQGAAARLYNLQEGTSHPRKAGSHRFWRAVVMNLPDFLTQEPDGFIHITGHRIGLTNIVHYYNEGFSAEMLLCEFPTLSLVLIHKTIAFYLENRDEVDAHAAQGQEEIERQRATGKHAPSMAELRRRLEAMQR